jgi:hypothetical protein
MLVPERQSPPRYDGFVLAQADHLAGHPGVAFRDGPAGRRAGVVGGPDVWEVVQVFLDEVRHVQATAATLNVSRGQVEAAIGYYAHHPAEIDAWIESNHREAEEAEAAWRGR